jgi:antitoxin CptB
MLAAHLRGKSGIVEVGRGAQMGPEELNRLRWQCRRGLLELDLLLERFLEAHRDRLQGEHLSSFLTLLAYTDNDLLDLIRARSECTDSRLAEVLGWMRNC